MRSLLIPALLAAPVVSQDIWFPEGEVRVELPLHVNDYGDGGIELHVDVSVDGKPARFLFDTGAKMAIDEQFAKEHELARTTELLGVGVTQVASMGSYRVRSLRLGSVELENFIAGAIDSSDFDGDGLLGSEILAACVVELDLVARRMILHDADRFEPPEDAHRVELMKSIGSVDCRAKLGGIARQRCVIDTGNATNVLLHWPFVRKHGLLADSSRFEASEIVGVFGSSVVYGARLAALELGDVIVTDVPVDLVDESAGGLTASGVLSANLGMRLLSAFRLWFDGRRHALWLASPTGRKRVPYRDTFGIVLDRDGVDVRVAYCLAGSPSEPLLEPNDVILEVAGEAAPGDLASVASALRVHDQVDLVVRRGSEEREVSLERRHWLPLVAPARSAR